MKNLFLTLILTLTLSLIVHAQEGLSGQAGLSVVSFSAEFEGQKVSASEIGVYAGLGYQIALSEIMHLQPSVLFSNVKDLNSIYVPVMFKYKLTDALCIQGGPQINYLLDGADDSALGIDIAAGLEYKISEKIYAQARYGLEVSRNPEGFSINTLQVGVGYNF